MAKEKEPVAEVKDPDLILWEDIVSRIKHEIKNLDKAQIVQKVYLKAAEKELKKVKRKG